MQYNVLTKTKNLFVLILLLLISFLFIACTPVRNIEIKQDVSLFKWKTIAVMPFVNSELLGKQAGAWLSQRLSTQNTLKIINEAETELLLSELGYKINRELADTNDENKASLKQVLRPVEQQVKLKKTAVEYKVKWFSDADLKRAGALLKADAMITGYIHAKLMPQRFFVAGLRLVDVNTGVTVLESQTASYAFSFFDYHKDVEIVIDDASHDLLSKLVPGQKFYFKTRSANQFDD